MTVFDVGDIIKHKREDKYYVVVRKQVKINLYEIIVIDAVKLDDSSDMITLHHPLMTCYYERVKKFLTEEI